MLETMDIKKYLILSGLRLNPLLVPPTQGMSSKFGSPGSLETIHTSSDQIALANSRVFLTSLSTETTQKSSSSFNSSSLASTCSTLSVAETLVAKVVPSRIFSLALHPSSTLLVAAVGDKSGHVGLWDMLATPSPGHGIHLYHPHTRPVNSVTWDIGNTNNVVSTSYDGTTRMLDTEKQKHIMIYGERLFIDYG